MGIGGLTSAERRQRFSKTTTAVQHSAREDEYTMQMHRTTVSSNPVVAALRRCLLELSYGDIYKTFSFTEASTLHQCCCLDG